MLSFHLFHMVWEITMFILITGVKSYAKNSLLWCCLSRFMCFVISELDLLWCPSLIKGHTVSGLTLDASKVNASSLRKSSLEDKWSFCEMWSSRVKNKQIALLDTNVLSSLAPNGGFWQDSGMGYPASVWRGECMWCFSFLMLKSTKQIGKANHSDLLCLLIAGPNSIYRIQMRTEPLPQLIQHSDEWFSPIFWKIYHLNYVYS